MCEYRKGLLLLLDFISSSISDLLTKSTSNEIQLVGLVDNLAMILDKADPTTSSTENFHLILKTSIIRSFPHLLLSYGPNLVKKSNLLLLALFRKYKTLLKRELYVILDTCVSGVLRNQTAPFFRRQYMLNLLCSLLGNQSNIIYLYLNYDCCTGYGDLLLKILSCLCRYLCDHS